MSEDLALEEFKSWVGFWLRWGAFILGGYCKLKNSKHDGEKYARLRGAEVRGAGKEKVMVAEINKNSGAGVGVILTEG